MKIQDNGLKVCSKCKKEKYPTQFYKDKKTSDGLAECCKVCNSYRRQVRSKNYKRSMSDHIADKTEDGVLMADYNIGILKAVKRVKDKKDLDVSDLTALKGTICVYKGIPITAKDVQDANRFLMENWKGRPGQRVVEPDKDERSFSEKFKAMEFNLKEMGYGIYKLDKKSGEEEILEDGQKRDKYD
jgi:hypothetical protein|tara:strand:+ start:115 stop:672 length:558 start_codon:yes stop_codon:yes gene_type:complete